MATRQRQHRRPLTGYVQIIPVALLAAVTAGVVAMAVWPRPVARPASASAGSSVQVGHPAPIFEVPALTGGQLALAQYAGHPRVLTFFATSCGECLGDLAVLEPVYRQYRSRGLVVLGVGVEDMASNLRRAAARLRVSFPLGYDEDGDRVVRLYGLSSIPTTVFMDGNGIVTGVVQGSVRGETLQRNLALILPRGTQ